MSTLPTDRVMPAPSARVDGTPLQYPLAEQLPPTGDVIEVAPGVFWLRMGLPFALNHINLWLLRDEVDGPSGKTQGWTLVD